MPVDRSRRPAVGPDPAFTLPDITPSRLENGLALRLAEHVGVPVVTFLLLVPGGVCADAPGREGLTALTADMVDEGCGDLDAIGVSDALARIGADYEADVSADYTLFRLTTLVRFADRGAGLLADLVARPRLAETDFARVRQLRLDRLRQLKDHPPAVADRRFLRQIYGAHPYGHPAIGQEASLGALTLEDVRRAHAEHYRPGRATLIAVGAMPVSALDACVTRAFAGWSEPAGPGPASCPPPPAPTAATVTVVTRAGAAQSELRIGQVVDADRRGADYAPLIVMNAVLGGQFVSRVNLKLREEKGFTYGARTGFEWRRQGAVFSLETSVHTASTGEAVADAWHELRAIRGSNPPTVRELELAKASLTRGYPRGFETSQQVARSVATLVAFDLPDDYFVGFVPRVNRVTAADVDRVAAQYLDPDRFVTLLVGDPDVVVPLLRTHGAAVVDVVAEP